MWNFVLLTVVFLGTIHGMEMAAKAQAKIIPSAKLEKLHSLSTQYNSQWPCDLYIDKFFNSLYEPGKHFKPQDNLVHLVNIFNETGELTDNLGTALQSVLEDQNNPNIYLAIYSLKIIAENCELVSGSFLAKHNIVPCLLSIALVDSLTDRSPRAIAVKAITILRSIYCRLGMSAVQTTTELKQLYLVAKNTKPHQHLAAVSLYICILLYPINPTSWKPESLLNETISLLSSEDPKVQVLCLEALLQIQGPNLVRSFVDYNGLAHLAKLIRSPHRKVPSFACLASSRLLGENPDIFFEFVSSGCFDLVLDMFKSDELPNICAASIVIRCLVALKNDVITSHLDNVKVYEALIYVLHLEDDKEKTLEINTVMDILECLESILLFSENIGILFDATMLKMEELGLHRALLKFINSCFPIIASQASKLKYLLFQ